jgi:dTMP kinase
VTVAAKARFIALEGPDGAGKSLQAVRLADALGGVGRQVTLTREPGGTPLGESIRALLLDADTADRSPEVDALLFNAARAQLVRDVIRPALGRGEVVVCDRFADSTLAYQGYGSGLSLDGLRQMERFATAGLRPDLVVLLDLPVRDALARRASGAPEGLTRFERSSAHDAAFHERVRQGYLELAAAEPERWRIVDAARDADDVAVDIERVVHHALTSSEPRGELLRIYP